ncbi:hypothetical protein [Streptomyces sp. NPDC052012]|uniref:hypothetical protein n=1 Tax=Streptomyces sp. NPDC052012 TaxID=3155051 RepID=UPI00344C6882
MTPPPTSHDRLPVYESLVRELGDVLTETREVAERTRDQARQALAGHQEHHREPAPRRA